MLETDEEEHKAALLHIYVKSVEWSSTSRSENAYSAKQICY